MTGETSMEITPDQVRVLCSMQGLTIPEAEIEDVATRMTTWLSAMEQIEQELGEQMNAVDPLPPISLTT
jgi:Asp-tRNA(Asn)/Glu-tRNA(Gln) amidotransferase C subunit